LSSAFILANACFFSHWTRLREIYKYQSSTPSVADQNSQLIVFQDKKIRRLWHNNEWYFSVVDVIEALTDSPTP